MARRHRAGAHVLCPLTRAYRSWGEKAAGKVRAAWEAKRDGGCREIFPDNLDGAREEVRARAVAGSTMRVNDRYVGSALRIQREAPELFEQMHAGTITIQAARKILNGEADDAQEREMVGWLSPEFTSPLGDRG